MSTPTPTDPQSSQPQVPASAATPVVAAPGLEVTLDRFWRKHGRTVTGVCIAILVGIAAKQGYDLYRRSQEAAIGREFAAATSGDKLKSFAAAHSDHTLAGMAHLALADEAYRNKKYAEAVPAYQRAAEVLKTGPFASRATLGLAVSKLQAGQTAEGLEKLKQIAGDSSLPSALRAEAAYHVAAATADANQVEDAAKFAEMANSLSPRGVWGQMAEGLRIRLPAAPKADAPAAPAVPPAPKS